MESRFDISAGDLKVKFEPNHVEEEIIEEVPKIVLAPFTNNTKLCFENVIVGTTDVQKLIVENPTIHNMKVTLKNLPPSERQIRFSWEMKILHPHDTALLEIAWNPDVVDTWRHTIVFQFGRCLKKDLSITFRSVSNKKSMNSKKSTTSKRPPQRHLIKVEPSIQCKTKSNYPKKSNLSKRNVTFHNEKENMNPINNIITFQEGLDSDEVFLSPTNKSFTITTIKGRDRRGTYKVSSYKSTNGNQSISEDSLEMSLTHNTSNNEDVYRECNLDSFRLKTNNFVFSPDVRLTNVITKPPKMSSVSSTVSLCERDLANISTETYIKGNISTETYVKSNLSSNTYVKDGSITDCSPICSKKSVWFLETSTSLNGNVQNNIHSEFNLSSLAFETSGVHKKNMSGVAARNVIEANLWGSENVGEYFPTEEPVKSLKRKSDFCFEISPAKKAYFGNQKTSIAHSQTLNWNKSKKIHTNAIMGEGAFFDPYMIKSVYQNEEWMEQQEVIFKKWLNALLTPPVELDANVDGQQINVAKLWQECKLKAVPAAPSKENISSQYHTNHRLESLRKSAYELFRSKEIGQVLSKTVLIIENQKLSIRQDKNLHLDLGLQSEVMSLFLSYNPLWLRIGLETLYNTTILLTSNSDIMGLSSFIMQHFFKDSFLLHKFKSIHNPKYVLAIKKFALKKFLSLVYFLDVAKTKTLIPHDPCLFRKNSTIKESKEIILAFSRELLSSVGDVTKMLRYSGYILNYKQKYIQEFDYGVVHLGVDLRDGVRLTKVMEIILMKTGFTDCLRVPAVSRLQKIHNMKIVFDALRDADFDILGDISPKDIVDGHYEKTLSFLWQIIYKFQAPLMVNAAHKILKWWRSLSIIIKRRIIKKRRRVRSESATKIQLWYWRQKLYSKLMQVIPIIQEILEKKRLDRCATKIQSYVKMYIQRKKFLLIKKSIVFVQCCFRGTIVRINIMEKRESIIKIQSYIRMWIKRKNFLNIRASAIRIQQMFHAKKLMLQARNGFIEIKAATLVIQRQFRATQLMRTEKKKFDAIKAAIITVQVHFKAHLVMKKQRNEYQTLRSAVISIQRQFRAYRAMKEEYHLYQKLKNAAVVIQTKFKAHLLMKVEYIKFNKLRQATKIVQSKFRANKATRLEQLNYQNLKTAVLVVQRRFRANQAMKRDYTMFLLQKRSAMVIQVYYRANKERKIQQAAYQNLIKAVINIQQRFRANKLMHHEHKTYQRLKKATIVIQQYYRAYKLMKKENKEYLSLRYSCIFIQRQFRAQKLCKTELTKYQSLREATIVIQRRYRARLCMFYEHKRYCELKTATTLIQSKFRANRLMKKEHEAYQTLRSAVIIIQARFRANKLMKIQKNVYAILKQATIKIQEKYRATALMKIQKQDYVRLRNAAIKLQDRFRSNKESHLCHTSFINLKKAVIFTQRQFRANKSMKLEQMNYQNLRNAALSIQRHFRANLLMKAEKQKYISYRKSIIVVQKRYRANKLMKLYYSQFNKLKKSAATIQNQFRANQAMRVQRHNYLSLKRAVLIYQRRFRANRSMQIERNAYVEYRKSVITIQICFKALHLMRIERRKFLSLKCAAITIQRRYRATKLMKAEVIHFKRKVAAVTVIQRVFRSYHLMKIERTKYRTIKTAIITIQNKFRATKVMQTERTHYLQLRKCVILVQNRFRARKLMVQEHIKYASLKNAAICIQQRFKANQLMKHNRNKYIELRRAVICIQRKFRAARLMKIEYIQYVNLRWAAICVQRQFRANLLMKTERTNFNRLKKAVIACQKLYRAQRAMRDEYQKYNNLKSTVILIQQIFRANRAMKIESRRFELVRKAAITIQKHFRANKVKEIEQFKYNNYKCAVVFIQRRFRANRQMKIEQARFNKTKETVLKLQRIYRANRAVKLERKKFLKLRSAAVIIQRHWKSYIQINGESIKTRRIQTKAAVKIQALWRGHQVRKNYPEITKIRKNVEEITTNALPENTLSERRERAIQILLDNSTLLQILRALEDLDFITRRCKNTLLSLSDGLPQLLYVMITSANRSPAEMEAATTATSILINLCKYNETTKSAWIPSYMSEVIKVMSHCCDKEDKLFSYLCTLIWLFLHNENYKQYICSLSTFPQMFKKIQFHCLRKQKMVSLKRHATFSYFRTSVKLYKPSLVPDWGLDYVERPRTFLNSIHALNSVLKLLDFIE